MAQLFRRRSNAVFRAVLAGGLVASIFGGGTLMSLKWTRWQSEIGVPLDQPVPFSHQHHVGGLGIDCRYCHVSVTKSSFAGMPPMHTCMTCHSQIWQDAPMLAPVRRGFAEHRPIEWNRVTRLPKFVYFNHAIHVNQGVACASCHGEVQKMALTAKARSFTMRDCLSCHLEPEKQLRPRSEVFNLDWATPPNQLELGAKLVREHQIPKQRLTECATCHR